MKRQFHHSGGAFRTVSSFARTWLIPIVLVALCVVPAFPAEFALLINGFRLAAESHEIVEDQIVLHHPGGGTTEVAAATVVGFEQDERSAAASTDVSAKTVPAQASPSERPAVPSQTPVQLAYSAAARYSLPSALVESLMAAESAFRPDAVSPKGAVGLMQLMPQTAREFGADATRPAENVDAGTHYLYSLLDRYKDRHDQVILALAAYNAGPQAVDKYHGVPPYPETQSYVRKVAKRYLRESARQDSEKLD